LTLKNTGITDGAEVVQLYASQKNPSVLRPSKELKAFKKVFLKAGESRVVDLEIPVRNLGFYDENRHDWKVEAGTYVLRSAASAADIKGSINVEVN
jgi:beta-glucosidase